MEGKTHVVVGIAASLAVTRPSTMRGIVVATSVGALGAIISDIDVGTSESHREADRITVLSIALVAGVLALDYFRDMGIVDRILANSNLAQILLGCLLFIGVCAYGKEQPHRSFMHSFAALLIMNFALNLIWAPIVPYFTVGFLSHIAIDFMNKKKVRVFYPLSIGVGFGLVKANGLVNNLLFKAAFVLAIIESVLLIWWSQVVSCQTLFGR